MGVNYFWIVWAGVSANADPHYHKLRSRVTRIWGNRWCQSSRIVQWPDLVHGGRPFVITVPPLPGKYAAAAASSDAPRSTALISTWDSSGDDNVALP